MTIRNGHILYVRKTEEWFKEQKTGVKFVPVSPHFFVKMNLKLCIDDDDDDNVTVENLVMEIWKEASPTAKTTGWHEILTFARTLSRNKEHM